MLGFQAKPLVLLESTTTSRAIKEVSRVELQARLRRIDFHNSATRGISHPGCQRTVTACRPKHITVVLSLRKPLNLSQILDSFADRMGRNEIEWGAFHVEHDPGRDERVIHFQVLVRLDL